ncbi:MAG: small neutral amino acid transporter SnatA (MarC family) [Roseivirga sp.]|jgi:small neutral amino acid transporter SnatA (MarC family)
MVDNIFKKNIILTVVLYAAAGLIVASGSILNWYSTGYSVQNVLYAMGLILLILAIRFAIKSYNTYRRRYQKVDYDQLEPKEAGLKKKTKRLFVFSFLFFFLAWFFVIGAVTAKRAGIVSSSTALFYVLGLISVLLSVYMLIKGIRRLSFRSIM